MRTTLLSLSMTFLLAGPAAAAASNLPATAPLEETGVHISLVPVHQLAEAFADELGIAPQTVAALASTWKAAQRQLDYLQLNLVEAENAAAAGADPLLVDVARAALVKRRRALRDDLSDLLTPAQRQDLLTLMGFGGLRNESFCF